MISLSLTDCKKYLSKSPLLEPLPVNCPEAFFSLPEVTSVDLLTLRLPT